jgi:hypothetical protein
MALSLSSFLLPITLLSSIAQCATVTHDFDIAWTYANPDGQATRPVMGVNGKWPVPAIVATKGDQVIVNVKNSLGNESTSLHFHGLYMNGTTHMDGPVAVSQCGIPPGSSFTYNFTVSIDGVSEGECGSWFVVHEKLWFSPKAGRHRFQDVIEPDNIVRLTPDLPADSSIGRPSWLILVAQPSTRPVPRWPSWSANCA